MKLLFVGEDWQGSRPRSLREALGRRDDVVIADVGVDHHIPRREIAPIRAVHRLARMWEVATTKREILRQCDDFQPDIIVFYKGFGFDAKFIAGLRESFSPVVNVFPDYSPHSFGKSLARAIGEYSLVISTKAFHPPNWSDIYGYGNRCVHVPHGYDPLVHYRSQRGEKFEFDAVLIASGRPQYYEFVEKLSSDERIEKIRLAIVGNNWDPVVPKLPSNWCHSSSKLGVSYIEWLRKGKIVISPLHTRVVVDGVNQPGDVDTARTYELAAAYCFFIHKRTPFVADVYDEATEVPMFDTPAELADKILYYLDREDERAAMADAAHRRAVPAYSFDARAAQIKSWLDTL